MLLKAPIIDIDKEDPFKNDLLDRKESAEILTELIKSYQDESFVLCIDAPWGEGKTTFLRMWRQYLINLGFSIIFFNAWENDFSEDALVSLIGELDIAIEEFNFNKGKKAKIRNHINIEYFQSMPFGNELMKSNTGIDIEVNLAFGRFDKSGSGIVYDKYKNMFEDPYKDDQAKKRAKSVLDLASSSEINYIFGGLDCVVKKIEIASRFSTF